MARSVAVISFRYEEDPSLDRAVGRGMAAKSDSDAESSTLVMALFVFSIRNLANNRMIMITARVPSTAATGRLDTQDHSRSRLNAASLFSDKLDSR